MNCFELLKRVLDDAYAEIPGTEKNKDEQIATELGRLSDLYKDLRQYKDIDYSKAVTRFAYVYSYVTCHANLVYQLTSRSKLLRDLFKSERVQVACIGGGPGSDLIGLLKFLEERRSEITLSCMIYDRETAWGETWAGLLEEVDSGVNVLPAFMPFDVVKENTWTKFRKYLSSDLFTMIYFMSEVYGLKDNADAYFAHLMGYAKPGALFLFVDNRRSGLGRAFSEWFDELAGKYGLELLEVDEGSIGLPYDEEKKELGVYFKKFRSPKLTADIAWRVARKKG